jgi:hypothetical protein
VFGAFLGKPQGQAFYAGGMWWRISYTAGNGNEVSLTVIAPPAPTVIPRLTGNASPRLMLDGEPNQTYRVMASTNLSNWAEVFLTNPVVLPFFWTDTGASNLQRRYYRALLGDP